VLGFLLALWTGRLEVGPIEHQEVVVPVVGEGPQHRVALTEVQPAAGDEQARDHRRPRRHRRQPAQCADAGVDHVEDLRQPFRDLLDAGFDVAHRGSGSLGEVSRDGERTGREVHPRGRRAEARQRQGVGADVALQVHRPSTRQVAEVRGVEGDHRREVGGVVDERLQAVGLARCVDRHAGLPVGEVDPLDLGGIDGDARVRSVLLCGGRVLRVGSHGALQAGSWRLHGGEHAASTETVPHNG
jgi:hypothetical protein